MPNPRIFYSWASDHPGKIQRHLIREAIKLAIDESSRDVHDADRPELTSDTKGVAGTPDIFSTIKQKILGCDVFIADLTPTFFKGRGQGKRSQAHPNPNVLIELGIAKGVLPDSQIILVCNTGIKDFEPEQLPFNIRHSRSPINFSASEGSTKEELRSQVKMLSMVLSAAIEMSISSVEVKKPVTNQIAITEMENKLSSMPAGLAQEMAERRSVFNLIDTTNTKVILEDFGTGSFCTVRMAQSKNYDFSLLQVKPINITGPSFGSRYNSGDWGESYSGHLIYAFEQNQPNAERKSDSCIHYCYTGEAMTYNSRYFTESKVHWMTEDFFAWSAHQLFEFAHRCQITSPVMLEFLVHGSMGSQFITASPLQNNFERNVIPKNQIRYRESFEEINLSSFLLSAKKAAEKIWNEASLERPSFLDTKEGRREKGLSWPGWWNA